MGCRAPWRAHVLARIAPSPPDLHADQHPQADHGAGTGLPDLAVRLVAGCPKAACHPSGARSAIDDCKPPLANNGARQPAATAADRP
jgi:hypothetical protein